MNFNEYSQPWQRDRDNNFALPLKANNRFLYIHHPNNWELVEFSIGKKKKFLFLPNMAAQRLTPGVNGVSYDGNRMNEAYLRARYYDEGLTIIDPEKIDYIRVYPAQNGKHYTDRFTTLEQIGSQIIKSFDTKAWNEFRLEMMRETVIAPPHPQILRSVIIDIEKNIERKLNKQHIPEQKDRLTALQAMRKNALTAIEELALKGAEVYA